MKELDKFQEMWLEQNQKLDRNWKINMEILRQMNLGKVKSKLRGFIWIASITLAFYSLATCYFIYFMIQNWGLLHFVLAGGVLAAWSLAIAFGVMKELVLASSIDYSKPVTLLQKQLEGLKLVILRILRLMVWILPFHVAFTILFFELFYGLDIVANAGNQWLIGQFVVSLVVFLPLSYWMFRKLSFKNLDKPWMKSLLRDNGGQILAAQQFLEEIENFEKD